MLQAWTEVARGRIRPISGSQLPENEDQTDRSQDVIDSAINVKKVDLAGRNETSIPREQMRKAISPSNFLCFFGHRLRAEIAGKIDGDWWNENSVVEIPSLDFCPDSRGSH
jgi:hypothetical protein